MFKLLREFAVEVFLSYKSLNARKGKIQVPTSYIQDSPSSFFCPTSRIKSRKRRIFFRQSTYKGTYVEAAEFRQGWSVAQNKGDVRKKRRRPRKVAPRRKGSVCPQPRNFFFWFTSIWVLRDPSRLMYWLLRDSVYEEAMCEGSSGNGLPYAAKAVP